MAILKHINVHNPNYYDFVTYVLFQHDSHARPIYDENHVKRLRENVLIDAINTTPWTFNLDCQRSNRQWKKNREEREVKQHHFIHQPAAIASSTASAGSITATGFA